MTDYSRILITSTTDRFIAHVNDWENVMGGNILTGTVYFAVVSQDMKGEEPEKWWYVDSSGSDDEHETLRDTSDIAFRFSFCSRGVWEGRIYFPEGQEYWSSQLKDIALCWEELEEKLKEIIKQNNPYRSQKIWDMND